jgi:hypothetical protein
MHCENFIKIGELQSIVERLTKEREKSITLQQEREDEQFRIGQQAGYEWASTASYSELCEVDGLEGELLIDCCDCFGNKDSRFGQYLVFNDRVIGEYMRNKLDCDDDFIDDEWPFTNSIEAFLQGWFYALHDFLKYVHGKIGNDLVMCNAENRYRERMAPERKAKLKPV